MMDRRVLAALRRCNRLFRIQIASWIIAITGGALFAISAFVILRNCLLVNSLKNMKVQLVGLIIGLLTVGTAIAISRFFQFAVHEYNKIIEKPLSIKAESTGEWIATVKKTVDLKNLGENIYYGRYKLNRNINDLFIVLCDVSNANQIDFQGVCIAQATKHFHIQFRGTKEELAHKLNLFVFLRNSLENGTPQVDIDHYSEGGFRIAINLSIENGEIQLPQMVGKIGTFIPHYYSGVKWTIQSVL